MVQKNILVSILINNYNNENFVKESINSCLKQSYKNIEIIIYDDKSNDGSVKIIKKIKNKKIKKIFNKKKLFKSSALNQLEAIYKSFLKSKGKIIFLLDSDDFYLKNKVKLFVNFFEKKKNLNFIQANPIYFFPKKKLRETKRLRKKIFTFHTWPYFNPTSTMAFRREFLSKVLKEISFSKKKFGRMFFDARAFIYIYFFENNYLRLNNYLTLYNQNDFGDTIKNYDKKNSNWWKRRYEYHQFVQLLFLKKNKVHLKFIDYFITFFINLFLRK